MAKEAFLSKDVDFKAALTKLKAANPDALYIPGYYEEVSKIIKQAREVGITTPLLGSDGWDSPKLVEIAGKESTDKTYFTSAYTAQDKDPGVQKFINSYKEKYGKVPDVLPFKATMPVWSSSMHWKKPKVKAGRSWRKPLLRPRTSKLPMGNSPMMNIIIRSRRP